MRQRTWKFLPVDLILIAVCCIPRAPIEISRVSGVGHIATWIDRRAVNLERNGQNSPPPLIGFNFLLSNSTIAAPARLDWLLPSSDSSTLHHATLSLRIPRSPPSPYSPKRLSPAEAIGTMEHERVTEHPPAGSRP